MDLTTLTIPAAAEAFRRREYTPLELTEVLLTAIERLNPDLNAYLTITADSARSEAQRATEALARGQDRGPLHGIPLALKDLFDVAGVRTTAGSKILADHIATADAAVTEKLRAAGAVFLGKLHLHEWALGVTNINPHFGPCRNPWCRDRIPGGSSGGAGAALAAGLCLGAFGSDTGGSIRIPAALCGVVGLKPTYGRISLRGVIPLSWSLDHAGPMARTVRDVALLLQATAGYDPADPVSADVPVDDYLASLDSGLAGVRLLVPQNFFFATSAAEVVRLVEAALGELERLGGRLEAVNLPGIEELSAISGGMNITDAATYHADHLQQRPEEIGADVLARLRQGAEKTGREYALARQQQREWRRRLELLLAGETLLVTPTTPIPAPPIVGLDALAAARQLTRFTAPFNFTGLPALSLPCGFTAEGLPVGLQIVGRPWAEALVLRAAQACETAFYPQRRRPPV